MPLEKCSRSTHRSTHDLNSQTGTLSHRSRSLGMKHFYQEIVARHLSTQVFVAQVILGLRAERAHLR